MKSDYKYHGAIFLGLFCFLFACKTPNLGFNKTQIDDVFLNDALGLIYKDQNIFEEDKSRFRLKKYEANISEELIDIDHIGQYKLINIASDQKGVIDNTGNSHELYLYFYTKGRLKPCLFLSSRYNKEKKCTSLGPAYIGEYGSNRIFLRYKLPIKKKDDRFYLDVKGKEATNIIFVTDELTSADITSRDKLKVIQIIRRSGGTPPEYLVFDVPEVFRDSSALIFINTP